MTWIQLADISIHLKNIRAELEKMIVGSNHHCLKEIPKKGEAEEKQI